jgi:hypothetical protein
LEQNQTLTNTSELWVPDFHPAQSLFYESEATKILWAGDTRAGKSAGVKMSLIRWCALIPGLECDVFRLREDDVKAGYMEGEFGFPMLLNQWYRDGLVDINATEVRFWNGSFIKMEHCFTDAALTKHQGIPRHVRIVDEAGQIPERRLKWLELWMIASDAAIQRIPPQWRHLFPKIIFLMNRMGPSKNYFRNMFVRKRPKYAIEKVGAFRLQYLPADVHDNPSENAERTIERVTDAADSATAKALLSEDGWDAQTGNYFDMWESDRHVVKDFIIPDFWLRYRCFDYGSYEPWACVWVAVSPGVMIHEGTTHERYLPRGCKVYYREWYGCKAEHADPAIPKDLDCTNLAPLNWSNKDIAEGVIDRTEERFDGQPTFTDKFPFIKLGGRAIEHDFKDAGLPLTLGEVDRKNRGAQTRSMLAGVRLVAGSEEHWPMMVFFESCKYCQDYMPMIERHPDEGRLWDYVEDGEPTHIVDCVTLGAMAHATVYDAPTTSEAVINKSLRDPRNTRKSVRDLVPEIGL